MKSPATKARRGCIVYVPSTKQYLSGGGGQLVKDMAKATVFGTKKKAKNCIKMGHVGCCQYQIKQVVIATAIVEV